MTPRAVIWQLLDSSQIGGIESHVAALSALLNAHGRPTTIVLLAPHPANPWLTQLAAAGLAFRTLEGGPAALLRALRRDRPALLHTHGYKAGILGRPTARLAGVPVVSTFHAGERAPFPVSLYQDVDAWTSRLAPRIAVSAAIAETLPFPATVIANFVQPGRGERTGDGRTVAFVGRLSPEKGPDLFCEIAERSHPSLRFEVYGDGPMRAELEAEHGDRVRFHGVRAGMAGAWPSIDLLLMPSRAEGLPMAALEAMAAGAPVLASRVGGLPTLIDHGETGWLFEAGAVDEAAALLSRWRMSDAAMRQAVGVRARAAVAARFGPDQALARFLAVYRDAGLDGSASARSTSITVQSSAGSTPTR